MRNCIEYVLRTDKTERDLVGITGPFAADEINYDTVYQSFLEEKKMWNKDSGRMYAHNVISWHKDEDISLQQARDFGKAFAEKWFQGFQTLYTVHKEREHVHVHFITNTVSYEDGRKLHNSKKDMERMKALTNKMCKDRGLTVAEKGVDFHGNELEEGHVRAWNKDKYHLFLNDKKKSHVADCALAVLESKEISTYRQMFIREMNQRGWKVTWKDKRKNITFENAEGKKVRASNLSKTFNMDITKETLINEFKRQASRRSRDIEKYNGEDASAFIGKLRSEERAGKQEQYHKEAGRQDREDARERSDRERERAARAEKRAAEERERASYSRSRNSDYER